MASEAAANHLPKPKLSSLSSTSYSGSPRSSLVLSSTVPAGVGGWSAGRLVGWLLGWCREGCVQATRGSLAVAGCDVLWASLWHAHATHPQTPPSFLHAPVGILRAALPHFAPTTPCTCGQAAMHAVRAVNKVQGREKLRGNGPQHGPPVGPCLRLRHLPAYA